MTVDEIKAKKVAGQRLTMLTAYDYPMAKAVDESGIDIILVGDSLGMVVLGYENTLSVTMDDMIRHASAARKGTKRAHLVGDMPYKSYDTEEDAVKNARRFMDEAGCGSVKIEGGDGSIAAARAICAAGIPVMGHIGLTPQSVEKLGGFKVQGRTAEAAQGLIDTAVALEGAGCYGIVLECIPSAIAELITAVLTIPTIGIGAGPACDGQVLVLPDILGLFDRFLPKFAKRYADLLPEIKSAIKSFREETVSGKFPAPEHSYKIKQEELDKLK